MLSTSSINFGTIVTGANSQQNVEITNNGNADLVISSTNINGQNLNEFLIISGGGPGTLSPSNSRTITLQFSPQIEGNKSAYLIISSNAGTSPDTVALSGIGLIASIQVEPETEPTSGENLTVRVTPTENFQPTTGRLYYRTSGEYTWQYIDLQTTGDTLNFEIPANSVTYQGVEYYVYLSDGTNEVTYPPVNPQTNPVKVQTAVTKQEAPLRLSGSTYKMVSVPINLENPEICNVLCDDYENHDIKYWRILRWQTFGDSTGYFEYPYIQAAFTPGNSFWLITRSGNAFDVANGWSINTTEPAYYTAQPGWNQVASPFPFPVSIDSMSNVDSLEALVYYNGSEYVYNQTILYPWEGNFVYNPTAEAITVAIPPKAYQGGGLAKAQTVFDMNGEKDFLLQLSARMTDTKLLDTQNFVGLFQQAQRDRDEFDVSEAPPIGEFIQCSILNNGQRFAANFKPLNEIGQQWEVEIRLSEFIKKPVEISLSETGTLPEGFNIYILDKEYFYPIAFENNKFTIELTKENPVRQLKLIIGTEEFAQQNSDDIPLVPIEYLLKQNYPNPFNSATLIQYQLGKRTPVELSIFDILGRKVQTLINERQSTGFHSIPWDGLNDVGVQVASGVYLYQLKAGNFIETKKLLLVR